MIEIVRENGRDCLTKALLLVCEGKGMVAGWLRKSGGEAVACGACSWCVGARGSGAWQRADRVLSMVP